MSDGNVSVVDNHADTVDHVDHISSSEPMALNASAPIEDNDDFSELNGAFAGAQVMPRQMKPPQQKIADARQSQASQRIKALESEVSDMSQALADVENELELLAQQNQQLRQKVREYEGADGQNDPQVQYIQLLLSSAGVPENDPSGNPLELSDRVVFITSQHNVSTGALLMMRNELMSLAHSLNRSDQSDLANEIMGMLKRSNRYGSILAVSDIED